MTTNLTNLTNNKSNFNYIVANESMNYSCNSCSEKEKSASCKTIIKMIHFKQESYQIVGAAMEVYNQLGHGFLEAVYQEVLEREFIIRCIPYEREKELTISYKGEELKQKYKADFVCYGNIIVELKAVSALEDSHRSQIYNYLRATKSKLGILLNFGNSDGLEWERKVL